LACSIVELIPKDSFPTTFTFYLWLENLNGKDKSRHYRVKYPIFITLQIPFIVPFKCSSWAAMLQHFLWTISVLFVMMN